MNTNRDNRSKRTHTLLTLQYREDIPIEEQDRQINTAITQWLNDSGLYCRISKVDLNDQTVTDVTPQPQHLPEKRDLPENKEKKD